MRAAYAVAGLALAVTGCEKAQADRVEKSETTMDDRGARPQYVLRYEIPAGFAQQVDEVMDVELHMTGAQVVDVVMPRMVMTEAVAVDRVDSKGAMHVTASTSTVRVEDDARTDGRVAAATSAMARGLEGLNVTGTLLPDGKTHNMRVDIASVPEAARETARQIEQALDQLVAQLPDVAVGEGARWTVEETIRASNMRMFYTRSYEVLAISEDHATLHVDVKVTAPPQPLITPQGTAHLDALVGEGAFDMEIDRKKLIDHVRGGLTMGMTVAAGGQVVDMDMAMGLEVLPTGEAPALRTSGEPSY